MVTVFESISGFLVFSSHTTKGGGAYFSGKKMEVFDVKIINCWPICFMDELEITQEGSLAFTAYFVEYKPHQPLCLLSTKPSNCLPIHSSTTAPF